MNSPCQNELVQTNEVSWLKCQNENLSDEEVVRMIYPLGTLNKCGYYDWYLMKFQNGRFSNVKIVNQKTKEIEEGKAGVFIEGIRGSYSNVVGLPIYNVKKMLDSINKE